ncbi:BTAD domain-containing putative transcriptional regulator [Asanoa sp. WMMD1127]|uniref:AfsR/SARP family transcriptional regulator n=1 Tax=Asanoa sp. WMMD1127 TaxID=3016107 RepID=UPI0024170B7A|nr:BTAD domain-containing putative transcriptional regulator [Asanoa sp. WMMD1127]MDG4820519.1 BTAD domain-containing putative transcriptional regulator [Asanoa sp. WMMD1127]
MRIQALGPVRIWDGAQWAPITATHLRIVLAVLLAEPGRPVPRDRLVHEIWGERPTRTAASAVNGYVMRLRRLLRAGEAGEVVSRAAGYELVTDADAVDIQIFERMVRSGRRYVAEGRMADAARQLSGALALWRGAALADVPPTLTVAAEAARLEQLRLAALEERFGAQLAMGQHTEIVEDLATLAREHPLRERLSRHLMIALYRCGRRAEALEAYRRVRDVLVTETGIEPGPELRDLEHAVLTDDRTLAAPTVAPVTPAQLPAAVVDFAGRHDVFATLDALAARRPAPPVVIAGLAGAGKTAAAVQWGHSTRDRFPDGQLCLDLRGASARPPVAPMEALAHFLHALGVAPDEIPGELDEAVGLWRSVTAVRRILVVLDNAATADQVRPLLPGGPGCMVVVTSRDQLRGLTAREGAVGLELGVLAPDEAVELVGKLVPGATEAEAAELARLCGHLPLAVRIAAANLNAGLIPIGHYNWRLAAGDRLDALGVPGDATTATATAFDLSYEAQPPAARRLFGLLGAAPGDTVTVPTAAAVAGGSPAEVEPLLDTLARNHLLDQVAPGRYRWHDLVRLYARRRGDVADRDPALDRLYDHYLSTMDAAADLLYPHVVRLPLPPTVDPTRRVAFGGAADASHWLDSERDNMIAAIMAAGPAHREAAWRLTDHLRWHLDFTAPSAEWLPVTEAALAYARADDDPLGQAAAHLSRATVLLARCHYPQALDDFQRALDFARDGGWAEGQTSALSNLAHVAFETGQLDLAARYSLEALDLDTRIGRLAGQLARLANLGNIRLQQGRLTEAVAYCRRVIDLETTIGEWHGQGTAHGCLGEAYLLLGRRAEALTNLEAALATHRRAGARSNEADILRLLAVAHPDPVEAQALATEALRICREVGDRWVEAHALLAQAELDLRAGDADLAIVHLRQVLAQSRGDGARHAEAQALIGLAKAHRLRGADAAAGDYAAQASAICRDYGYELLETYAV